jgi:hypothetical protein
MSGMPKSPAYRKCRMIMMENLEDSFLSCAWVQANKPPFRVLLKDLPVEPTNSEELWVSQPLTDTVKLEKYQSDMRSWIESNLGR